MKHKSWSVAVCLYSRKPHASEAILRAMFWRQKRAGRTREAVFIVLLVLSFNLVKSLWTSRAFADTTCPQSYIDSLPVPKPLGTAVRVVQLVNCSPRVLLGAANAAGRPGSAPFPVFPREKTWVMQPYGSPNNKNILTIDIPAQWANTGPMKSIGPNVWARTGCRYDAAAGRAQCETGGCGGQYDCSAAALGIPAFTSFTEWNFFQPPPKPTDQYHIDNFDISVVNGTSLNVDIKEVGGDSRDPGNPNNTFWLALNVPGKVVNYPMTVHGADLRATCPSTFRLKRSQIDNSRDINGKPLFGYVQLNDKGLPVGGDNVIACLNNCGYYKYPFEPSVPGCTDPTNPACYCNDNLNTPASIRCYNWKTFCAGDPFEYGTKYDPSAPPGINNCKRLVGGTLVYDDKLCPVNGACWKENSPSDPIDGTCQLRAFYKNPASDCPVTVCTFKNPYKNPLTGMTDLSTQPPAGLCGDVIDKNGQEATCVGDDTVHEVYNRAYTWPNDPQTYADDAPLYRVVYSPGGTSAPITPAQNGIPLCSSLAKIYDYATNAASCSVPIQKQNAVFAVANANGTPWGCSLDQRGAGNEGVICRWKPAPTTPTGCSPPVTDANVTKSACGTSASGTSLVSTSITPATGDPLFAGVTIPAVLNNVNLPSSIGGCASPWTVARKQFIATNRGLAIWYRGIANTNTACKVTVKLEASNPAAIKIYDIPKSNGTVDTANGASGGPAIGPQVTSGSVTTTHAPDLLLGNLLLANQAATPQTYWTDWLTTGLGPTNLHCENTALGCPKDDGTDYLPGDGPFSGNADTAHLVLPAKGTYMIVRRSFPLSNTNFGGAAIAIELKP